VSTIKYTLGVHIKKNHLDAIIPTYAKEGDAGMDLTAVSIDFTENYIEYDTGLQFEIPEGYVGLIFPRSSISNKDMALCNAVGVIDSLYRGNVTCRFRNTSHNNYYLIGDRVAQIVIMPYPEVSFIEVEELSTTERGEGGYGSSGL